MALDLREARETARLVRMQAPSAAAKDAAAMLEEALTLIEDLRQQLAVSASANAALAKDLALALGRRARKASRG